MKADLAILGFRRPKTRKPQCHATGQVPSCPAQHLAQAVLYRRQQVVPHAELRGCADELRSDPDRVPAKLEAGKASAFQRDMIIVAFDLSGKATLPLPAVELQDGRVDGA